MTGIIFDFNGTMVFDEKFHTIAWEEFLEKRIGRKVTQEEMDKYVHGVNVIDTLSYFLKRDIEKEELKKLTLEKEAIYKDLCLKSNEYHLVDGLEEFLNYLKENKIPMNIATAAGIDNLEFFFQTFNLSRWFDINKVSYDDGNIKGKPAPDIYIRAAERINLSLKDCIVFEDAISGIIGAKRGCAKKVVGLTSSLSEKDLLALGVDYFISDYRNLKKLKEIVLN